MSQNINGQNLMAEQTELLRKQARLIKIQTAIFSAFMFIIAVVLLILCTKLNGIISEANSAISQISGLTEQLSAVLEESNLTELLTKEGANIVFINYSRISTKLEYGDAIVELALEIKGKEHKDSVYKILLEHGYQFSEMP